MEPLSEMLQLAREAGKIAKRQGGRNALAVTLTKRGGADRTVFGKWGTLDERLRFFVRLHRREAIPDSVAYELHDLVRRLQVRESDPAREVLDDAMRKEAMRILKRKRAKRGQERVAEETLRRLEEYIASNAVSLDRLADELIVARVLADAADLADLPLHEEETRHGDVDH
jgi:CRISPR-associated protein Cmr2